MANLSRCQNCQRSGIAILSGFLQNHFHQIGRVLPKSGWNPFYISQHNSHYYQSSPYPENGVKKQKRKKVKLLLWKTETLQPPVPRLLVENWEQRWIFAVLGAFILVFSRYPGISVLITSASDGIPVFTQDLAYTGTTGLSGCVPAGRCCLWATDSLKVSSLKIILSGVVLLTAALSWQPLSLQLQGPELNEFPITNGLCISKDMPTADAASPCSLFSL